MNQTVIPRGLDTYASRRSAVKSTLKRLEYVVTFVSGRRVVGMNIKF